MTKAEAAAVRGEEAVVPQAGSAPPRAPPDELKRARARIAELERKIGQQELDLDFFQRALRYVEEAQQQRGAPGGTVSTRSSKR